MLRNGDTMGKSVKITVNGKSFRAEKGEVLLDAALRKGVELPHDCRAGHCGTCRLRLLSGNVKGGKGTEPGVIHACQARVAGDAVVEPARKSSVRKIDGVLALVRPVTADVMEVGIAMERALPYLPGQYAKLRFEGYPGRPYSITHPLYNNPPDNSLWFHIRRFPGGRVSSALGARIVQGHPVELSGPHGAAHFRPGHTGRMLLVATSTGFAPIWSIAAAALRENPQRPILIIAGGRSLEALYMTAALERLASFPNVHVVPVCSSLQAPMGAVYNGRPTDYLPALHPSDVIYACGAPGLVDAIKAIAAQHGVTCHADPFLHTSNARAKAAKNSFAMPHLAALAGQGWQPPPGPHHATPAVASHGGRPLGRMAMERAQ